MDAEMKKLLTSLAAAILASTSLAQYYSASIHIPGSGHQASLRRGAGGVYGGYSIDPGSQVWRARILGESGWIDLTPPGQFYCRVNDVFRTYQVGYCGQTYTHGASLWRGTASSFINLHPPGQYSSVAYAMEGQRVVGYTRTTPYVSPRAAVWTSSSAGSMVDVHPSNWTGSVLHDTDGIHHVGVMSRPSIHHAGLWEATSNSVLDLNPWWATNSLAWAMNDVFQVGYATIGGREHAVRWSGSSYSAVDLHPPFAHSSSALGIYKGIAVGYYALAHQNDRYAAVLDGPYGFIDLHQYLPAGYINSTANGIASDGYILGEATLPGGEVHAVIWKP